MAAGIAVCRRRLLRSAGVRRVQGLQIDFDSPTAKLVRYADWVVRENEGLRDADATLPLVRARYGRQGCASCPSPGWAIGC